MSPRIQATIKQSAIYTLPGIAGQLVGIVLVPIYTRIFVPADYGVMAGVILAAPIATFLCMFAMESGIFRFYYDAQSDRERKLIVSTGLYFVVALSVVVIGTCVMFFPEQISQLVLHDRQYSTYFILALAAVPFGLCYKLAIDVLRLKFQVMRRTMISIAHMLVNVGLSIYLVVFLRIGIMGVFLATLITNVTFMIAALLIVRNNYIWAFSWEKFKPMLRFCAPLVPTSMAFYIFQYADRYLLIRLTNLKVVGLYSIGMALASILYLLVSGFQMAWAPTIYSSYGEEKSKQFYARVFNYFWALLLFGAVGLSLFGKEAIMILCPETYLGAYSVVPILVMSAVFFRGGPLFSFGIGIAKKTHYNLILMVIAVGLNIGLNLLLIPRYGMIGAAVATLISAVCRAASLFIISQKLYHVDYDIGAFARILAVAIAAITVANMLFSEVNWQNILIKIGLVAVYVVCLFVFHMVGKDELIYVKNMLAKKLLKR